MSKEKQIEELAEDIFLYCWVILLEDDAQKIAEFVIDKRGYRKQIEGEWTRFEVNGINYGQVYYQHKECKANETQLFPTSYNFCPNCGAHMRKEDEGK